MCHDAGELAGLDATAQAELVRRGACTAAELVEAAIARIEAVDPGLNAVVVRLFDDARRIARGPLPPGPFRGVPFLMKDVGARQAGQPYYAGNRALRDAAYRAPRDTPLGARFRDVGFVTVGKSSTPELGMQSTTQPLAFGPTRNPWDPSRSSGGSSGGACAAVASGMVPAAHASDGAGSIRIPAAWCGLVGFKPSRGRIVAADRSPDRTDVEFAVARSLRDTSTLLHALGADEPSSHGPGARPAGRLRVAWTARSPAGATHPACARAVSDAAEALATAGHRVREDAPGALYEYEERSWHGVLLGPAHFRERLDDLCELLGRPLSPDDVEPFLWELAHAEPDEVDPADHERAVAWVRAWGERVAAFWRDRCDVLVTPTVPDLPPRLGELDANRHDPVTLLERMTPHMAFTEPFNATGQPALSLPLGWSAEGLPVGVQLVAARGADELLLQLGAGLLPESGTASRRPAVHA